MNQEQQWKEEARESFEIYLDALERDLPAESSIAEIEQTMLEHHRKMMSETMQSLIKRRAFPPSDT